VAQVAVLSGGAAWAQTTDATSNAPAKEPANTAVVVVSGQRAALQSAQKLKQDADEVVDSIVAEDIGKLPDRSITEVLSRVAGITMDRNMPNDPAHQAIEGSGVAVRGLTYVRSEVNGRDAFSAGGGRALGFTDVSPELMSGVDVYKNPSAEQIEGAVSGLVNLRTAMPFDFKGFKGVISGSETYSTLRKGKAAPTGTILLSNRWNTRFGEFGALIDLANSRSDTRTDAVSVDPYMPHVNSTDPAKYDPSLTKWWPTSAGFRSQSFERVRRGDYAAFQWRPNKDLTASLQYFKTRYRENWDERAVGTSEDKWFNQTTSADTVFDKNGVFQSGTISNPVYGGSPFNVSRRISDRTSGTRDISLNLAWRATSALRVTTDLQKVHSTTHGFDSDVSSGFILPSQYIDTTGEYPKVGFADAQYMTDPHNYFWSYTMEALDRATADQTAWRTDLKYDFDHPVLRDIRFGVRLTDRKGVNDKALPYYNWQGVTFPWMEGWQIPHVARLDDPRFSSGATLTQIPNFFDGKVALPAMLYPDDSLPRGFPDTYAKQHSYHNILCNDLNPAPGGGTCDAWKPASFDDPASRNTQSEKTNAAYAQLRFAFDDLTYPVDGNVGVRYVQTHGTANGYVSYSPTVASIPAGANVTGADTLINIAQFANRQSFDNKYHNWLPSLNLKMKTSDQLQFRFAVARSMSRPDFNQLQAQTSLSSAPNQTTIKDANGNTTGIIFNGTTLTGTNTGNPMLRPVMATSVDLTAEWYFAKAGSLTFAAFDKDLSNIIVTKNYLYTSNDVNGKAQNFLVTGPVNGAKGFARGFEIAHQQYYDFVPDWLKGIGTQASWTYVSSERKLNDPVSAPYCAGNDASSNFNLSINGCDTDARSFSNLPLEGLSRQTINFAVMYEHGGWSTRLAYNWRSKYMVAVNSWGVRGNNGLNVDPTSGSHYLVPTGNNDQAYGLPLWQAGYGQLDGSIFYNFTDRLRVGLEAQNLNNAKTKQIMQQHVGMFSRQYFMTGPRYTFQATYSF
jgi:TonB-dependent receptor